MIHNPKAGETVWLIPIRYWEPDDYKPEQFDVEHVTKDGFLYGLHHGYGHNVYIKNEEYKWFYMEAHARTAQLGMKVLYDLRTEDLTDKCMETFDAKAQSR